jgi:branched-chain amino acid transport system substrate-binding protein
MRKTRTWLAAAIVAVPCMTPAAMAAEAVKIGFVATFSGPAAAIGNDMRDGFNLGLEHLGHRMAGKPVGLSTRTTRRSRKSASRRPTS